MSTVATCIESTVEHLPKACCKKNNKSTSKICKGCLSFILSTVDLKENVKKTVRKPCLPIKLVSKSTISPKKSKKCEQEVNLSSRKGLKKLSDSTTNVDKYTQLKLKEITKKQIISEMRIPLVKTAKGACKTKRRN